ncbi:MAG: DUF5678 domain-containing protein [Dehalococcoidia bacterium]
MEKTRKRISDKSILSVIGDPRAVDRELAGFRRSARRLSTNRPRFIDKYPSLWVAVHEGRVVAQGETFSSVMAQIDKEGLPRKSTLVRRIDRNPRTMIL